MVAAEPPTSLGYAPPCGCGRPNSGCPAHYLGESKPRTAKAGQPPGRRNFLIQLSMGFCWNQVQATTGPRFPCQTARKAVKVADSAQVGPFVGIQGVAFGFQSRSGSKSASSN